jgi:hypothetical protein
MGPLLVSAEDPQLTAIAQRSKAPMTGGAQNRTDAFIGFLSAWSLAEIVGLCSEHKRGYFQRPAWEKAFSLGTKGSVENLR